MEDVIASFRNSFRSEIFDDDSISSTINSTDVACTRIVSKEQSDKEDLAQRESRAVFQLRLLVLLVLLLAAVAVSVVVFFTTHQAETSQFATQYEGAANKVIETFSGIAEKLGGISALGVSLTAHSIDGKSKWPFVTLSSFQERATTARTQSGAVYIAITPVVADSDRTRWENYTLADPYDWMDKGLKYQSQHTAMNGMDLVTLPTKKEELNPFQGIWTVDYENLTTFIDPGPGPYLPIWQISPLVTGSVNLDTYKIPFMVLPLTTCITESAALIGDMVLASPGGPSNPDFNTGFFSTVMSYNEGEMVDYEGDPMSYIYIPVFDSFKVKQRKVVAVLFALINWGSYFETILPQNARGITVVLENPCYTNYTYQIDGDHVERIGPGDQHDPTFHHMEKVHSLSSASSIPDGTEAGIIMTHGKCPYNIRVYPSSQFQAIYVTSTPIFVTIAVTMIFVFTAAMFFIYDRLVERRQRIVMKKAIKSSAIVASLFPKNVRERLMQGGTSIRSSEKDSYLAPKHRIKSFLGGASGDGDISERKPIADLFPNTTVLFADIAGFTAWSSTRDPTCVFLLLQSVYQTFDNLAQKRKVFKVETIGDSYVAVTGLPEPQASHALIMAKFAVDCMHAMKSLTEELELALGPGTSDLAMRFGMHSGPVTAGVLRGDKSRFQLFGDTVNTAARMESTGARNKIQASQTTADILVAAGKGPWVMPREDTVEAKGKGALKTFWIMLPNKKHENRIASSNLSSFIENGGCFFREAVDVTQSGLKMGTVDIEKHNRLIDWVTELLKDYIKPVLARRAVLGKRQSLCASGALLAYQKGTALDEAAETIKLPEFDHQIIAAQASLASKIVISDTSCDKLRKYVAIIASMYRSNPFHNFEHACHVTMSVHKFIQRIVMPDIQLENSTKTQKERNNGKQMASRMHDYTHGIISDPVTLFAIVFSALIHDVDHRGVSNVQLMKEDRRIAAFYKNKSVAEQNSLSLAWDLFMSVEFTSLRIELFGDVEELKRFRQVVVNVVLATDIFDKEMNDLRKSRWEKAFSANEQQGLGVDRNNLRATIVIEHIIQASDVSHTMQHWHVYRKWNTKLFQEMRLAHRSGRMVTDPAKSWYHDEIQFFDNYVIPLAKKLKDCNVFGVSSDECLNYALCNRAEWEERGKQIIAEMLQECD